MRWKKWAIGAGTTTAVAIPTSLLIAVAATPRPPFASSRFLLNFVDEKTLNAAEDPKVWATLKPEEKKLIASQNYVNKSIELVDMVLDEYAKQGKNPSWDLQFSTLNASPTNDELNFFQELTRAILYISQGRINFQLIPRTPTSVAQGFNNKDQQMVSWYWNPDYNGLGTWLGYNFSPDFLVPNMWPWLCAQLQNAQNQKTKDVAQVSWQENLTKYLSNIEVSTTYYSGNDQTGKAIYKPISFKIGQMNAALNKKETNIENVKSITVPNFTSNEPYLVPSVSDMYDFVTTYKIKGTSGIYATIQNAIAAWSMVSENNQPSGSINKNTGKIENYKPSQVIELVNTLNYNPNIIPFIGDGPESKNPKLVRYGANAPENPKAYSNTRDWFLQTDNNGDYPFKKDVFSWQTKTDPFAQNITAWNPTFTENTSQLGKPTFVNLFSWTTVNNPTETIIDTELVAEGTNENAGEKFENEIDNIIKWLAAGGTIPSTPGELVPGTDNIYTVKLTDAGGVTAPTNCILVASQEKSGKTIYTPRWQFDFPIRPIQWVDSKGKPISEQYLSPRDFWAGWKGYKVSCDGGLSHNSYFIDMLGVDMNTTLSYGEKQINDGKYVNKDDSNLKDPTKWEKFTIFMNNPTLPGQTCKDILTNQYFGALPYSNEKVQNIVGKDSKIKYTSEGKIDKNTTFGGNQIYGSGLATESYRDLWYASPYIVGECNQSSFTLTLNEKYFEYFKDEASQASTKGNLNKYLQFNLETNAPFGPNGEMVKIKKMKNINVSYLSYNIKTTFDQFKNGARDMAEIPSNEMSALGIPVNGETNNSIQNPLTKDIYSPLVAQENKTNLIPYNTNVFTTTTTRQGINVYQAQLTEQAKDKGIDTSKWAVVPGEIDQYGNTITWKPIAIDANVQNGVVPEIGDLQPILKEHIPSQYYDLIVKNYNSNAKMSQLIDIFTNKKWGTEINGQRINGPEDILNFSSIIIRNTINNAINWLEMADICFPNNNKSPQLSFTPYGVFNTNDTNSPDASDSQWKYYNIAWEKPDQPNDWNNAKSLEEATEMISNRVGGILKFTKDDYETASSIVINN